MLTIFSSSREVREQSLSRRDGPTGTPPLGTYPPENPSPGAHASGAHSTEYHPPSEETKPLLQAGKKPTELPKPKGSNVKQMAANFIVGTAATMTGLSILKGITGSSSSAPVTSSTDSTSQNPQSQSTYPPSSTSTQSNQPQGYGQQYQGQYRNQQRGVDHGKRADFFREPHSSHGL